MDSSQPPKYPDKVKTKAAWAIRALAEVVSMRNDSEIYAFKSKFKEAMDNIQEGISDLDYEEIKLAKNISNFGGIFHTFTRKGLDGLSDSLLYKYIHLYGAAWTDLLKFVEDISKEDRYKDCSLMLCLSSAAKQWKSDKTGAFELRAALNFLFLEYTLEDLKENFKHFCGE